MQTKESIQQFSTEINTLLVKAKSQPELYRKLNTLEAQGRGGWQLLCAPRIVGEWLVAVAVRPAID